MAAIVPEGLDPELIRAAQLQPDLDYAEAPTARAALARAERLSKALRPAPPQADGQVVRDRVIPARGGSPGIGVRTYDPQGRPADSAALVFFHGGAFVAGGLDTEDARCREIASRTGALVVSVDYRLAPEHPFPSGFEDCLDALLWTAGSGAAELSVSPLRIAVGGTSAGGALAAAVALAARERSGPPIALQMLLYPVIDDALTTASMRRFTTTPGWNRPNSVHMWRHYLGSRAGGGVTPAYAAPARAEELSGLPPAYIMTAEFDPLRDEGLAYGMRLLNAGVPTELHNFPGAFHGFDAAAPDARVTRRALDEQCAALARATGTAQPVPDEPTALTS